MTVVYLVAGYKSEKDSPILLTANFPNLKIANEVANEKIRILTWEHFTIIPVAIPNASELELM